VAAWEQSGAGAFLQQGRFLLAETCSICGRREEALELLKTALTHGTQTSARWCEARVHHLRAQLFSASSEWPQAEECLRRALEVARQQNARSFELRSAISLARLWRDHGQRREARDLLAPVYGWFTDGFDTPDLREAKALLDLLQ